MSHEILFIFCMLGAIATGAIAVLTIAIAYWRATGETGQNVFELRFYERTFALALIGFALMVTTSVLLAIVLGSFALGFGLVLAFTAGGFWIMLDILASMINSPVRVNDSFEPKLAAA